MSPRDQYIERELRLYNELRAQVELVAAELNKIDLRAWQVDPPPEEELYSRYLHISTPAGHRLTFQTNHHNRLCIDGTYPRDHRGQYIASHHDSPPKITVSRTRPPAAIAKEITRRLLPGYLELYENIQRRVEQMAYSADQSKEVADKIARILEAKIHTNGGDRLTIYDPPGNPHSAKFEVVSPDRVYMDLRTDPLTAQRIAMILAD